MMVNTIFLSLGYVNEAFGRAEDQFEATPSFSIYLEKEHSSNHHP